jgi:hypothetical protein
MASLGQLTAIELSSAVPLDPESSLSGPISSAEAEPAGVVSDVRLNLSIVIA